MAVHGRLPSGAPAARRWDCRCYPLLVHRQYDHPPRGPDVRDPHFYFVSNGIVLDEAELADPACSLVLQSKLESYFPLLSRLILLRQRQPMAMCS